VCYQCVSALRIHRLSLEFYQHSGLAFSRKRVYEGKHLFILTVATSQLDSTESIEWWRYHRTILLFHRDYMKIYDQVVDVVLVRHQPAQRYVRLLPHVKLYMEKTGRLVVHNEEK